MWPKAELWSWDRVIESQSVLMSMNTFPLWAISTVCVLSLAVSFSNGLRAMSLDL